MTRIVLILISPFFLLTSPLLAQIAEQDSDNRQGEVQELSLKQALSIAESNNYEVQKAQKEAEITQAHY